MRIRSFGSGLGMHGAPARNRVRDETLNGNIGSSDTAPFTLAVTDTPPSGVTFSRSPSR